jgi:hypothetical protein
MPRHRIPYETRNSRTPWREFYIVQPRYPRPVSC